MKPIFKNKCKIKLYCISFIIGFLLIQYLKKIKKKLLIEVDISGINNKGGPGIFIKGINDILPYRTRHFKFVSSQGIYPNKVNNKSDFFYLPFPFHLKENIYNKWVKNISINKRLS